MCNLALMIAVHCRDAALNDLSSAYSDMQAMQAALLDSALYVRFLRAKLLEAQLAEHRSEDYGALAPSCPSAAMLRHAMNFSGCIDRGACGALVAVDAPSLSEALAAPAVT